MVGDSSEETSYIPKKDTYLTLQAQRMSTEVSILNWALSAISHASNFHMTGKVPSSARLLGKIPEYTEEISCLLEQEDRFLFWGYISALLPMGREEKKEIKN